MSDKIEEGPPSPLPFGVTAKHLLSNEIPDTEIPWDGISVSLEDLRRAQHQATNWFAED